MILLPVKDYVKYKMYNIMGHKQKGILINVLVNLSAPALVNTIIGIVTYNYNMHKILLVELMMG